MKRMKASDFPRYKEVLSEHLVTLESAIDQAPAGEEDTVIRQALDDFYNKNHDSS